MIKWHIHYVNRLNFVVNWYCYTFAGKNKTFSSQFLILLAIISHLNLYRMYRKLKLMYTFNILQANQI